MYRKLEIVPVDFRAGDFTYGQRIELASIASDPNRSEGRKFIDMLHAIYPKANVSFTAAWFAEYERLIDGLRFWIDKEQSMLQYNPSADEIAAGIQELTKKLGPMSTVIALATKFSQDPDTILEWKYAKVFGLLYADIEAAKFQKRLSKISEQRAKAKRLSRT